MDGYQLKVNPSTVALPATTKRGKKKTTESKQRIAVPSAIRSWIASAYIYVDNRNACVKKDDVYNEYLGFCARTALQPANKAVFGKMVNQTFDNKLQTRRLGCRGNSESYYQFLTTLSEVQRRRHEATMVPSPCVTVQNKEGLTELFNDLKFSHHTPLDFAGSASERANARLQYSPCSSPATPVSPSSSIPSPGSLSHPCSPSSSSDCEYAQRKRYRESLQESSDDDGEYVSKNSPGNFTDSDQEEEQDASEGEDEPPIAIRFTYDHRPSVKRRRCESTPEVTTPVSPLATAPQTNELRWVPPTSETIHVVPQPKMTHHQQTRQWRCTQDALPTNHPCRVLVDYRFDLYGNLRTDTDEVRTSPNRIPSPPADTRTRLNQEDIWYNCVTAGVSSARPFYSPPSATYSYFPGMEPSFPSYGVNCPHRIFPSSAGDALRRAAPSVTNKHVIVPSSVAPTATSPFPFSYSRPHADSKEDTFLSEMSSLIDSSGYLDSLLGESL